MLTVSNNEKSKQKTTTKLMPVARMMTEMCPIYYSAKFLIKLYSIFKYILTLTNSTVIVYISNVIFSILIVNKPRSMTSSWITFEMEIVKIKMGIFDPEKVAFEVYNRLLYIKKWLYT